MRMTDEEQHLNMSMVRLLALSSNDDATDAEWVGTVASVFSEYGSPDEIINLVLMVVATLDGVLDCLYRHPASRDRWMANLIDSYE